jgi:hypothetical protein
LLKGFFDETGPHKGSVIAAIGGFVGHDAAWDALEPAWQGALKDAGVSWLQLAAGLAQDDGLARLSQTLAAQPLQPFFSAVVVDAWPVLTDASFLKRFPTPLDLCFENLVSTLWRWGGSAADGAPIMPMFVYRPEFSSRLADIGRAYGSHDWYSSVLGPIAFGHQRQVTALQAADLLVRQARWDPDAEGFGLAVPDNAAPAGPPGRPGRRRYFHGNCFDAEGLLRLERRFRYFGYPIRPVGLA